MNKVILFPDTYLELYRMLINYCDGKDIRVAEIVENNDRMSDETTKELSETGSTGMLEISDRQ